jgi:hypothetical protein
MIEAAKVIVPIGEGKEVEARAIAAGLRAFTESYREDGLEEAVLGDSPGPVPEYLRRAERSAVNCGAVGYLVDD